MTKLLAAMALLAPVSLALAQEANAPAATPAKPAPAASAAVAENPDKVIIQVGDEKITVKELSDLLGPQLANLPATHRGRLADQIVQLLLLAQEGQKRGLQNDIRVRMGANQALAQVVIEQATKPDDEATLKAKYDADKSQFEQVKARHILIRGEGSKMPLAPGAKELSDAEAKAKAAQIRDRIVNKKEDFATVAKAESDEQLAKTSGGDLGSFGRGMMTPPFEQAAFALKDGEVSEPVKTEFGWHVIQVQEHINPSFEQVKAENAQQGQQQGQKKITELIAKLKASASVKIDDAFFSAAPAQPPVPQLPAGHPALPPAAPAK